MMNLPCNPCLSNHRSEIKDGPGISAFIKNCRRGGDSFTGPDGNFKLRKLTR